jgi:hypothetical protein
MKPTYSLPDGLCWEIAAHKDEELFFPAVAAHFAGENLVFLEESPVKKIGDYFLSMAVESGQERSFFNLFQARYFLIPLTAEFARRTATFFKNHAASEVADHSVLLDSTDRVLIEWYDAFGKDPIFMNDIIPEVRTKQFSDALNCAYKTSNYKNYVKKHA